MLCNTLNLLISIIIAIRDLKKDHDDIRVSQRLGGDSTNGRATKLFSEAQNCSIARHVMFNFFAKFSVVRCNNTKGFFKLLQLNSGIWHNLNNPDIKKILNSKRTVSDNLRLLLLLVRYLLIFLTKELVIASTEENKVMCTKIKEYIETLTLIDMVLTDMMNEHPIPIPVNLKKKSSPLKPGN